MGTFLSWKANDKSPGGTLEFDLTLASTLSVSATPTSFPVERGANISDHIRDDLDKVSLEVFVSNSPVDERNRVDSSSTRGALDSVLLDVPHFTPPLNSLSALLSKLAGLFRGPPEKPRAQLLSFDSEFSAPIETWDVLNQLKQEKRLIDVFARDWIAEDMVITSLTNPQTFEEGDGCKVSIELQHIRIVETVRVSKPISAEPKARAPVSAGKKDPKDAAKPNQSVAHALKSWIFGGGSPPVGGGSIF